MVKMLNEAAVAIKNKEKEASSYYFYRPEDDSTDNAIYGFEIYGSKQEQHDVHLKGEKFLEMAKVWQEKKIVVEVQEYTPVLGFVTKPESVATPAGYIWEVTFTALPGKRAELLEKVKALTSYSEENEPGTLTYVWLESLTDPNVLTIFERYKTKESLTHIHRGSEFFQEFMAIHPALVSNATRAAYVELNCGFISDK
eukprot:Phypoly_transcript_18930.p1 GENE.Phypoly_transcript_18930~~Phypoly_transcript_18930.p1  ORF type:complete len:198 (-),score=40.54 Phypoly_transcript_18930:14-607(-)